MPAAAIRHIRITPGRDVVLDFDAAAATYDRSGNDLVFALDSGGKVVIDDFFVPHAAADKTLFVLMSGDAVTHEDFLSALTAKPIEPGAGCASTAAVMGAGDYLEDFRDVSWLDADKSVTDLAAATTTPQGHDDEAALKMLVGSMFMG